MVNVIGVTFKDNGMIYYFSPSGLNLTKKMNVIVQTEKGLQFAITATDIMQMKREKLNLPLMGIIRIATEKDVKYREKNIKDAELAVEEATKIIKKLNLNMKIMDAFYTFDRKQLLFQFTSEERVDFRELARQLASIYKTRIELRQIGVRDKAREIGGLGPCGRELCCTKFLTNFDGISINMAKNQNIALNPTKINGSCNRLLCCLDYEDDLYTELRHSMPEIGQSINTKEGNGRVISIDLLNGTYKVNIVDVGIVTVDKNDNQ